MITITANHTKGFGQASKSIPAQKKFLSTYTKDLSNVYDGTLNLSLDTPLFIASPDIETDKLQWSPKFPPERFFLTSAGISIEGNSELIQSAWIYEAEFSPNRGNPYVVEILTTKLVFKQGARFSILIPRLTARAISAVII